MKKQLLNESDIRKMMKFANIGALTDGFVTRLNETYLEGEGDLKEQEEEELDPEGAEEPEMDMDMGEEPEMDASDEEVDEQAVLEMVAGAMEMFQDALRKAGPAGAAAADAITVQETGGADEDPGMDDMGDMGDMGGKDLPADDMAGEELPMGDEGELDPEGAEDEEMPMAEVIDEDAVMNEVTRRVARRLMALKRNK